MANIRRAAQDVLEIAKEGIGWIVFYRNGRGWGSTYCYPEFDENTCRLDFSKCDEYEMSELREIVEKDPMAIIVNSYVMNLGDRDSMTRDSLAEALKWQYELNHAELRDALPEETEEGERTGNERIKVLVIEPGKNPEEREIDNTLEAMQEIVGGYIECVTMATDLVIIDNEEGRLMDLPYNRTICCVNFVGTIIMAGVEGDEFADLPASLDDLKMMFPDLWEEEET
ncbi:MAG: DUF3846 domain-containing protein [Stomatobaculum sp.]|nr:DUF3846 domain-containing protein [Stomatobaculum sp.]MBR7058184.1 DUF3846 domain-containing protein [Stomatobaculum sp.]